MDSSERVIESINSSKFTMKKCHSKTIRLTVDLSQTDKDGCAIFNYQDLVKAEKVSYSFIIRSEINQVDLEGYTQKSLILPKCTILTSWH